VVATLLVVISVLVVLLLLPKKRSTAPPVFSSNDLHETARWSGKLLEPLNTATEIQNGIVRGNSLKTEAAQVKVAVDRLAGQSVSWEMGCQVHETHVTLTPLKYGNDGKPIAFRINSRNLISMMVVDTPPDLQFNGDLGDHPDLRSEFIHLDVPAKISKADASRFSDRVLVRARIKQVETGKYQDEKHQERFLLYSF